MFVDQTNPNGTEQRKCGLCKETGKYKTSL